MAGESRALRLIQNYENSSDSERDSGYTSEEDKKRKMGESESEERKTKRRKVDDANMVEDMIVDYPELERNSPVDFQVVNNSYASSNENFNNNDRVLNESMKKQNIIPLPTEFLGEGPSHVDDPSKHQGRVRTFPHDPGNWSSIFYLPLDEDTSAGYGVNSFDTLQLLVSNVVKLCHQHNLAIVPTSGFHISLSKTLLLRIHMIQPLASEVRKALNSVIRFTIWLNKFEVYLNEDKTRTFLGLRVLNGQSELKNVVSKLDRILRTYNLPPFYKEGRLHASLAWIKGDHSTYLKALVPVLENCLSDYFSDSDHLRSFHAKHLHFKAGNRVHSIQLGQTTP